MGFVGDFRDVFVVDWVLFVEGVYSRGRVDIGRVVVLMWGILIHGVVRGLREVWPCGNHSHNIGFSLLLPPLSPSSNPTLLLSFLSLQPSSFSLSIAPSPRAPRLDPRAAQFRNSRSNPELRNPRARYSNSSCGFKISPLSFSGEP